jgi:hypothetical protein
MTVKVTLQPGPTQPNGFQQFLPGAMGWIGHGWCEKEARQYSAAAGGQPGCRRSRARIQWVARQLQHAAWRVLEFSGQVDGAPWEVDSFDSGSWASPLRRLEP